ncbi:MAG TPA: glyoxalase [Cytophagales bacterium]|nr:glyoxalase [Cytophagales bacterium]HAA21412.1 glyoxalase [Cytophagales bacterium]HAP59072.1 glyoxalase [Cytophagales bacterium]
MSSLDPFLAVKDVSVSAQWYQTVLGLRRQHGGDALAIMTNEKGQVVLCLHRWGEHEHPSLTNPAISPGNGLLLYFRVENLEETRQRVEQRGYPVLEDIHLNPNSFKKEFSLRDPDGYHLTISEYHEYQGVISVGGGEQSPPKPIA